MLTLRYKTFENIMGKGDNAGNHNLFDSLNFLSANALSLDISKVLS